ncbi:unnamed protein product, partial [Protopolystoma xenopodis]
ISEQAIEKLSSSPPSNTDIGKSTPQIPSLVSSPVSSSLNVFSSQNQACGAFGSSPTASTITTSTFASNNKFAPLAGPLFSFGATGYSAGNSTPLSTINRPTSGLSPESAPSNVSQAAKSIGLVGFSGSGDFQATDSKHGVPETQQRALGQTSLAITGGKSCTTSSNQISSTIFTSASNSQMRPLESSHFTGFFEKVVPPCQIQNEGPVLNSGDTFDKNVVTSTTVVAPSLTKGQFDSLSPDSSNILLKSSE